MSKDTIRVVYLGPFELVGGKAGAGFMTPERFASRQDWDYKSILSAASYFSGVRSGLTVGVIYESPGDLREDGSFDTLATKRLGYDSRADNPILPELEVRAKTIEAEKRAKATERKIKDDPRLYGEIRGLAQIWAASPYSQQAYVEAAILQMIRDYGRNNRKLGQ